jgi:indole-3-glycerol phosphate synthase/phosphoribosylanthranilate isomerase/anthranilate synthase/indole-3-glycerol phosphate synthase/phosphoribosylanthranilate isomerase
MTSFLAAITATKRAEMALVSASERSTVRAAAFAKRAGRSSHAFRQALARPGRVNLIAEVKRSSPSAGAIRSDADPVQVASLYAAHGAAAISVLTEPVYFSGSLADLRAVCAAVSCPALRKDFIVDAHQVLEAAAAGAEAVLLIVASLAPAEIVTLRTLAEDELGMDALVEVHDESEMQIAIDCGARIIGVNNRNLATLAVDLATSRALACYAQPGRVLVSESGLRTAADLRQLAELGYNAFLMGERLMRAPDPARELETLIAQSFPQTPGCSRNTQSQGSSEFESGEVKVKVCGLTDAGDARLAVELGATMLGFNFYPRSPRYIAPAQARPIIAAIPASIETVGVFVNATVEEIASAIAASGISAIQLHGDEPPEFCRRLKQRLPGVSVIKAFRTEPGFAPEMAAQYPADAVLIDAACAGFGGSGIEADWDRARAVAAVLPRAILAGGLTPGNVAAAIERVHPFAVDVCSGVEAVSGKGHKDSVRMHEFFAAVSKAATVEFRNESGSSPDVKSYDPRS